MLKSNQNPLLRKPCKHAQQATERPRLRSVYPGLLGQVLRVQHVRDELGLRGVAEACVGPAPLHASGRRHCARICSLARVRMHLHPYIA